MRWKVSLPVDPHGGNRDMAGWKLIGFPGARYIIATTSRSTISPFIRCHRCRYSGAAIGLFPVNLGLTHGHKTRLPRMHIFAIIGLGWTSAILANELTDQGLEIVAIERGPWRDTATAFNIGYAPDGLCGAARSVPAAGAEHGHVPRNNDSQTALPIRQFGSFLPGNGVGGAGVHWNGQTWRFQPSDFCYSQPPHRALRRELHSGRTVAPGLGHAYDELGPYYGGSNILRHSGKAVA